MESTAREAASAASPLPNNQTPERSRFLPRNGKVSVSTARALGLSLAALGVALSVLVSQTTVVRRWQLARRPLATLIRECPRHWNDPVYLGILGRRLDQRGRYTEADPILRRCVGLDPDEAEYRDEWARALLGSGLTTAAFSELKEFTGTHPDSAGGHRALGEFYIAQFSFSRADQELRAAVSLDAHDAASWAFLAQTADNLQDPARAAKAAYQAVRIDNRNAGYHRLLAGLLSELSDGAGAQREYEQAVTLAPRDAAIHREYAQWLLGQVQSRSQTDRALREAQQAAKLSPTDGETQFVLGQALGMAGQLTSALPPLNRAAQALPNVPAPASALAQLFRRLGRTRDAAVWQQEHLRRQQYTDQVRRLTEALSVHPGDRALHTRLAQIAGRHGDVETCVRQHAMALHAQNDSPLVMIAASQDLTAGGHAAAALPLAQRGVEIAQHNGYAYEALGDVLLALGQYDAAVKQYQTAVGWNQERQPILKARLVQYVTARASEAERNFREAERSAATEVGLRAFTPRVMALAGKALKIEPKNPRYLHFLLDAQIAQKKMADAVQTAQRLVAVTPHDARAQALLAVLLTDTASTPADFQAIESHLRASAADPAVDATRHYGLGLLALRRHQATLATAELTQAVRLDPNTDVTYYKLSQAEQAAGNASAAARALKIYQERQEAKRQEAALLSDIGTHQTQATGYVRLARLYQQRGRSLQARAVLDAAARHCTPIDLRNAERTHSTST